LIDYHSSVMFLF
jgi:hypothetical protein